MALEGCQADTGPRPSLGGKDGPTSAAGLRASEPRGPVLPRVFVGQPESRSLSASCHLRIRRTRRIFCKK